MLHAMRRKHSRIFSKIPRVDRFSLKECEKRRSTKFKQQFSEGDDFLLLLSVMTEWSFRFADNGTLHYWGNGATKCEPALGGGRRTER